MRQTQSERRCLVGEIDCKVPTTRMPVGDDTTIRHDSGKRMDDTGFDCSNRDGAGGYVFAMDLSQCDVELNPGAGDTFVTCVIRMARVNLLRRSSSQRCVEREPLPWHWPWVSTPENAITAFE